MKRAFLVVPIAVSACSLVSLDDLRSGDAGGDDASPPKEGGCGDTTSSSSNCGACGHDCLGGECKASVCQPLALAAIQSMPTSLAVDGAWLYWIASSSEIHRTPTLVDAGSWSRVGGSGVSGLTDLVAAAPTVHAISLQLTFAAVTVAENEPPDGAAPVTTSFSSPITFVASFGFDGTHQYLYAMSSACTGASGACILAFDDPTAAPKRFADDLAKAGWLTVDGGRVFYSSGTTIGTFVYADAVGAGTTIATTTDAPGSLAADANGVYMTSEPTGAVLMTPRTGGAVTPIASGQVNPRSIAARAGLVAWAADDGLWSCDPTACKPALAVPQATVSSIAIDSTAIYWTDPSRAGVYKVAR